MTQPCYEQSLRNMIWYYREELRKVRGGERATEVFSIRERVGLAKKGVLCL